MRTRFENKYWILAFILFALVSLVLLAGALKALDFRPAQPIGGGSSEVVTVELPAIGTLLSRAAETPFWQQVVFWVVLFLILLLITSLLDAKLRKQLIRAFIRTAILALGLLYIIKNKPEMLAGLFKRLDFSQLALTPQTSDLPAPVFQPPHFPSWLTYAIALGVTLLVVLFLWWMNRLWKQIRGLTSTHQPLDQIAAVARASLKDLETGMNSENAIIQCYERMNAVVGSKQGLHRNNAMTTSEFSVRLERSGLPREAVVRLTHLFESVRYGGHGTGPREVTEAVSCLTSILKYCGETL